MGDHAEAVEIDYDPAIITYADLAREFWRAHRASSPNYGTQYRSALFYHNATQRDIAEAIKAELEEGTDRTIYTGFEEYGGFTLAEDYHQKWSLRHAQQLMNEFGVIYPALDDFIGSTAVTRANGVVGGYPNAALLEKEIERYGLTEAGRDTLRAYVERYNR